MAITRVWTTSFEVRVALYEDDGNLGGGAGGYNSSGGFLDNGSCMVVASNSVYKAITATAQVRVGFYTKNSGVSVGDTPSLIVLRSTSTNVITIRFNGVNFELFSGATSLGTAYNRQFNEDLEWVYVSLDVKIDSSAGWVKFCVNGQVVFDYTGKTDHGASSINRVGIGPESSSVTWIAGLYFDHVIADDTTGEGSPSIMIPTVLVPIRPNGDGNYSQWDGSDGNQVSNYLLVDESPANTTDYVSTGVSGERDSYAMTTVTIASFYSLTALVPIACAQYGTVGETFRLFSRLSATDLDGAINTLPAVYKAFTERQTTKPGGGSWAQADIDAVEIGVMMP